MRKCSRLSDSFVIIQYQWCGIKLGLLVRQAVRENCGRSYFVLVEIAQAEAESL
jgi:hypothetical protein